MNASEDFRVRFSAETQRFESGSRRARSVFDRNARSIEQRAGQLDARLATTGSRFGAGLSRRNNQILGNVANQFQDIAVQAQMGTDSIRIFAQQGPQIAGAFGPLGAVIGALIGVVALGASAIGAFSGETKEAAKSIDDLGLAIGPVTSGISDLEDIAYDYARAIEATSGAQTDASNNIVAQTKREFEAKKELLALEVERLRFQQAERSALIAKTAQKADADVPSRREFIEERLGNAFTAGQELPDRIRKDLSAQYGVEFDTKFAFGDFRERIDAAEEAQRTLRELRANEVLTDIAIEEGEAALSKSFSDLAAGSGKTSSRSGGGRAGGRAKTARATSDIFSSARKRIEVLNSEKDTIGLYGVELERLQARQEAARLEADLLAKAQQDGKPATDDQVQQISQLKEQYIEAADAVAVLREAEEERVKAAKAQEDANKRVADGISNMTDEIGRNIIQAKSWGEALDQVAISIARMLANAAFGKGPLGGAFNQILGNAVGGSGIIDGLFNVKGNASTSSGVTAFAKGGVVASPTAFGYGRGQLGLMGEAGPEAIVPLKRGASGEMGVGASPVSITVINNSSANVSASESSTGSGREIQIAIEETVAASIGRPRSKLNTALDGRNRVVRR